MGTQLDFPTRTLNCFINFWRDKERTNEQASALKNQSTCGDLGRNNSLKLFGGRIVWKLPEARPNIDRGERRRHRFDTYRINWILGREEWCGSANRVIFIPHLVGTTSPNLSHRVWTLAERITKQTISDQFAPSPNVVPLGMMIVICHNHQLNLEDCHGEVANWEPFQIKEGATHSPETEASRVERWNNRRGKIENQ